MGQIFTFLILIFNAELPAKYVHMNNFRTAENRQNVSTECTCKIEVEESIKLLSAPERFSNRNRYFTVCNDQEMLIFKQ